MAQLIQSPLYYRKLVSSNPSRFKPKTIKIELAALSLDAQHEECRARNQNWSARCYYNVTGRNTIPCVWDVIFQ